MKKRSDGRCQYQLYLGKDENGKRKTKVFYGKSVKEARQKAEDYRRAGEKVRNLFDYIAASYLNGANADSTTEFRINHFKTEFAGRDISTINAIDIENALRKLQGKSQRTLTRYLQSLNRVFEFAIGNRITDYNPCRYVRIPKAKPPKERTALTEDERKAIDTCTHRYGLAARIMMYCGLRRGELTALLWSDIDLNGRTITVSKSYSFKEKAVKPPKTKSGIRIIPIPQNLLTELQSVKHKKNSYVIVNEQGMPMKETDWQYGNKHICQDLGFTFTWHQLRHTYATILHSAGVDAITAKELLGHSDIETTLGIYTHLDQTAKAANITKLDEYLKTKFKSNSSQSG